MDVILVIGSPNSSNSSRLRELGEQCGIASYLIDASSTSIQPGLRTCRRLGSAVGDSAPEVLVEEVVAYLQETTTWDGREFKYLTVIEEDVEFLLPKELIAIESSNKWVGIYTWDHTTPFSLRCPCS